MKKITLIVLGNLKEKFWEMAQKEYEKRISKFFDLKIVEIAEAKLFESTETEKALKEEEKRILEKIKSNNVFLFDPQGKEMSSEEFAQILDKKTDEGELFLVVGSSYGFSKELRQKFAKISFGKITMAHRVFRIVCLEQIYRAGTILNGQTYHK